MTGGDGGDTITAGAGTDNVSGGAGNDTINFTTSGNLTGADTIDGGEGTDTVAIVSAADIGATATLAAPVFTNVETISLTTANGIASVDLSGATSATAVNILAASDDAVHAINNMANGMTVGLAAETGTTVTSMTLDWLAQI